MASPDENLNAAIKKLGETIDGYSVILTQIDNMSEKLKQAITGITTGKLSVDEHKMLIDLTNGIHEKATKFKTDAKEKLDTVGVEMTELASTKKVGGGSKRHRTRGMTIAHRKRMRLHKRRHTKRRSA